MPLLCMNSKQFTHQKKQCLSAIDLSRKGSVDVPVLELVSFINDQSDMFTTSSCSGRIIVVDNTDEHGDLQKQGCQWLYVTHEEACSDDVKCSIKKSTGAAVFKFEPMVMHIQVLSLDVAQRMHSAAVASGFRNSGISMGGKGKVIVAVRSTHSLEAPLSSGGQLLVSDAYMDHLVHCANLKMQENLTRISRLFENLKAMVAQPQDQTKPGKRRKLQTQHPPSPPATDGTSDTSDKTEVQQTEDRRHTNSSRHESCPADTEDIEECFQRLLFEEET